MPTPESVFYDFDTAFTGGFSGESRESWRADDAWLEPRITVAMAVLKPSQFSLFLRERLLAVNFAITARRHHALLEQKSIPEMDRRSYAIPVADAFRTASAEYPSISVDPDTMSGAPCVRGTRIPVYMILDAIEYHGSLEGALKSYPRLTMDQIKDALGFAKIVVECPVGNEA